MSRSQFQAFLATVERGNLTRAAEELGYTQSGISHLLNSLEDECNLKLIIRDKAGAYTTSEGEEILPYIRDVCSAYEALDEKLRSLHRLDTGKVRIATFNTVSVQWLPGMMSDFGKLHPGITFELLHGSDSENQSWLDEGKVDLTFVATADDDRAPDFSLYKDPMVVVAPLNHPVAAKKKVKVEDIMNYPFINLNDDSFREAREITWVLEKHGVKPDVKFSETNDYAVVAMVEKGLGISILPSMSVRKTTRKIEIRPLTSGETRIIGINVKKKDRLGISAGEFINFAEEWVRKEYIGEG